MAVHILAGPLGTSSPLVKFVGPGVREVLYYTTQITAVADPIETDRLYVLDDARTTIEGINYFAVPSTHYTEWVGELNETFSSTLEAVTYINNLTFTKSDHVSRRFGDLSGYGSRYFQVDVNTPFTYEHHVDGAFAYYWNGDDFPNGVTLDSHDNRKISGIITQTGIHDISVSLSNVLGIHTANLQIEVI